MGCSGCAVSEGKSGQVVSWYAHDKRKKRTFALVLPHELASMAQFYNANRRHQDLEVSGGADKDVTLHWI